MLTEFGGNRAGVCKKKVQSSQLSVEQSMTCSMKVVQLNDIYMCTGFSAYTFTALGPN